MSSIFKFVINFYTVNAEVLFCSGKLIQFGKKLRNDICFIYVMKKLFTKAWPQTSILLSKSQCRSCRRVIFKLKMTHTLALLPDNMLQCPFLEQTREAKIWYVPVLLLGECQAPHTSTYVEL